MEKKLLVVQGTNLGLLMLSQLSNGQCGKKSYWLCREQT